MFEPVRQNVLDLFEFDRVLCRNIHVFFAVFFAPRVLCVKFAPRFATEDYHGFAVQSTHPAVIPVTHPIVHDAIISDVADQSRRHEPLGSRSGI